MRLVSLASCLVLALVACKDTSSPGPAGPAGPSGSPPPVEPVTNPASAGEPTPGESPADPEPAKPQPPPGVVVEPRPTPPASTPDKPDTAVVECTPDKRKGGVCTREYRPVCGSYADKTQKTFSNPCGACSDEKIVSYVAGQCAGA
jgi:hypothetical protein